MSIYLFKNGFINSKSETLSSEVLTILNGTAGITKILQLLLFNGIKPIASIIFSNNFAASPT